LVQCNGLIVRIKNTLTYSFLSYSIGLEMDLSESEKDGNIQGIFFYKYT